jgi:hypothetical protein
MMWVKCTTSAECKSIRIAVSVVMDGWNGRCLAVVPLVLGFQQGSCGNGSEYQWGTAVEEDFEQRK